MYIIQYLLALFKSRSLIMSVQGLDVNTATSSGAQRGGLVTPLGRTDVPGKSSRYKQTIHMVNPS